MNARPPYNLPMGRIFNVNEKSPVKLIRKRGWSGMTWVGDKVMSLGAKKEVAVHNTMLDLKILQGTTG
eukprot:CAMPEP_0194411978 /NCGR_PEP_ID=MMETSP0176-20130528/10319_1 /TAXON_ID=216777 /ORGANISM="Proboscia alata, Strain PI-D3" /LENGTH=67 /DNA_ID=CAMNT_0039214391 /DNA_START=1381 /DNA_END=1584 /DNA_ORIENTATION=-